MFDKTILFKSLLLGLVISLVLQMTVFAGVCKGIESNVLRLHIIANSDNEADQELKLAVRDEVLRVSNGIFDNVKSETDAETKAEKQLKLFKTVAQKVITKRGFDYPVQVSLEDDFFETRKYNEVSLPAGKYRALRVVIGNGAGKNWWCVMFPPMCLPAAQENSKTLQEVLDDDQTDAVYNADRYEIKFKAVEIYGFFSQKLSQWFS